MIARWKQVGLALYVVVLPLLAGSLFVQRLQAQDGAGVQPDTYVLQVNMTGSGKGWVGSDPAGISSNETTSATFPAGTTVQLTAAGTPMSDFIGWSGPCSGTGKCTLLLDSDRVVTATFDLAGYSLRVVPIGAGQGTVVSTPPGIQCGADCSERYLRYSQVTLSAAAFPGSTFEGWTGACKGAMTCTLEMQEDKTVTAVFDTQSEPEIEVTGVAEPGSRLMFTATLGLTDYDTCLWNFGDNHVSTCDAMLLTSSIQAGNALRLTRPHTYAVSGAYLVTVTAANRAGSVQAVHIVIIGGGQGSLNWLYLPHLYQSES